MIVEAEAAERWFLRGPGLMKEEIQIISRACMIEVLILATLQNAQF